MASKLITTAAIFIPLTVIMRTKTCHSINSVHSVRPKERCNWKCQLLLNTCLCSVQGTSGNSEPETQAAAATILKYSNNIRVLITIHSYGNDQWTKVNMFVYGNDFTCQRLYSIYHIQYLYFWLGEYWLTTWGYKTELPVDYEKQANLARRGVNAIKVNFIAMLK